MLLPLRLSGCRDNLRHHPGDVVLRACLFVTDIPLKLGKLVCSRKPEINIYLRVVNYTGIESGYLLARGNLPLGVDICCCVLLSAPLLKLPLVLCMPSNFINLIHAGILAHFADMSSSLARVRLRVCGHCLVIPGPRPCASGASWAHPSGASGRKTTPLFLSFGFLFRLFLAFSRLAKKIFQLFFDAL